MSAWKKANGLHNRQHSHAANCRTFARRAKPYLDDEFFMEELRKAFDREDIEVVGELSFNKIKRQPKPSYEELLAELRSLKEKYED